MNKFSILSPAMGQREDIPNILLNNAFTPENSNVQIWDGEVRTAKMRKKELLRDVYAITSVDTSGDTLTIADDQSAEFTTGDTICCYNMSGDYTTYPVTSVSVSGDTTISVSGDAVSYNYLYNTVNVVSNDPANDDFRKVVTPDGNPVIRYERFMLSSETERLIGFTKTHVYYWLPVTSRWVEIFSGTECEYWDACQYGDYIAMTNNQDLPQYWDGTGNTSPIDTASGIEISSGSYIEKAAFIASYENYLIVGDVTLSTGSRYQHYIYWSAIGEGVGASTDWMAGDSGNAYIEGKGELTGGFGKWGSYLIIFKRWSTRKLWFTGGSLVFNQSSLNPSIGCIAPGSVINDEDGRLYWYATDKSFREATLGRISQGVKNTARDINPEKTLKLRATYIVEYDEVCWAVPHGNSATENNKVLVYTNGKWMEKDIAVTAFGEYNRQDSYTWDTIPFATWDTWGWDSWDDASANPDFPVQLCGDSNGYTYEFNGAYTDDNQSYTSYFTLTTDMAQKGALSVYKRLLGIYVYVRKESSGTATLYVKCDNEADWRSMGDITLSGDEAILRKFLAVDERARHFLIKMETDDKFSFAGMEFEFLPSGDR